MRGIICSVIIATAVGCGDDPSTTITCGESHQAVLTASAPVAVIVDTGKDLRGAAIAAGPGTTIPSAPVSITCAADIVRTTVGRGGGCNPIPLPSRQEAGEVRIGLADLERLAAAFKAAETVRSEWVIRVDGKVRDRLTMSASASGADIQSAALASAKVRAALGGARPTKVIVVPGRLVSIVTRGART